MKFLLKIVKAIQEQSTEIEQLKAENEVLKQKQLTFETELKEFKKLLLSKK